MEAVPWLIGSKTLRDLAMMLTHRMKKSPRYRRKTTKVFDKKKNTAARKQVVPLQRDVTIIGGILSENVRLEMMSENGWFTAKKVVISELQMHSRFSRRCVFEAK